jgi:hypothetical protein
MLSASLSIHLAMCLPLAGNDTDLPCSVGMTRWVRSLRCRQPSPDRPIAHPTDLGLAARSRVQGADRQPLSRFLRASQSGAKNGSYRTRLMRQRQAGFLPAHLAGLSAILWGFSGSRLRRFHHRQHAAVEAQALLAVLPKEGWPAGVGTVLIPPLVDGFASAQGRPAEALADFQRCAAMFSREVWGTEMQDVGYLTSSPRQEGSTRKH